MSKTRSFIAALPMLAATSALAQVPVDYLVTAESGRAPDGFRFVDPATGYVTDVYEPNGNFLGAASTVAVDPGTPGTLYTSAGGSFGGPPIWALPLVGNTYDVLNSPGQGLFIFGRMGRMHATGTEILFTLNTVQTGLYTLPTITSQPTLIDPLDHAMDIAIINNKAYVNSYEHGQPSTIIEVDLATRVVRTLGTTYPTIRSIGTFSGLLLAGRDDGAIDIIDPTSGILAPFGNPMHGPVIAIVEGTSPTLTYFATSNNEVYDIDDFTTPIYVSPYTLEDIAVGHSTQAALLTYGHGCTGNGAAPEVIYNGGPALGTTWGLGAGGFEASAPVSLFVGFDRADFDLSLIGFFGCNLWMLPATTVGLAADASGNVSFNLMIPSNPSMVDFRVMGQYFASESTGLASSNAFEGILR